MLRKDKKRSPSPAYIYYSISCAMTTITIYDRALQTKYLLYLFPQITFMKESETKLWNKGHKLKNKYRRGTKDSVFIGKAYLNSSYNIRIGKLF